VLNKLDAVLGLDPIGTLAATGALAEPIDSALQRRAAFVAGLVRRGYRGPAFLADGRPVHDAGGGEAQELAFVLACGVNYLRALEREDLDLDAARRQVGFLLAADADLFLTLAKMRAMRRLWTRIEEAAGLDPLPVRLYAETAWRMTTRRDPHVNWLRTTVAAFAAGLGGADSLSVLPYTAALGLPDRFARRIARNTQLILIEESNLHRVADPGAGSGAIEDLTEKFCAAAWKLFQDIEAAGGAAAALSSGLLQRKVAEISAEREKNIAQRKDALTGTSEFPDLHEDKATVLDAPAPPMPRLKTAVRAEPLPRIRLSEPFERLRDAADGAAAKGKRPVIFLANLGPISAFGERVAFAKNLFEAGGIEALSNDGFASLEALVEAFQASGAKLACLVSSEEIYAREAEKAARALKKAGAGRIFLAGEPGKQEPKWRRAGIHDFVYSGCDVLAALRQAHATLGLEQDPEGRSRR
jgi:methylmalonyl-CoA mutase